MAIAAAEYIQILIPDTGINVVPNMCQQNCRRAVGVSAVLNSNGSIKYPTAISNWYGSPTQHANQDFPDNWVTVFFTVSGVPAGHVAWRAPDGSYWSSSSPTSNKFVHHPSLTAMVAYWKPVHTLTVLGWTEDIEDVAFIKGDTMTKDEAYKIVKWDYLHGTGIDPTSPQAESWANAIVGNPAKIDELGSYMNDQVNQRIQAAYEKGKAEADTTEYIKVSEIYVKKL